MENFKIMCHKYPSLKIKVKSKFYYFNRNFESFDKLSDDRRNELIEEANELKNRYIDNEKIGPVYYNILMHITSDIEKNKKYTPEEAIALLIETVDPNLKCLKVYMRSNDSFKTETIITEQFGFYDTKLIDYEREFAKRFNKSNSSALIKKLGKQS
jgi:hypothetical protein